MENSKLGSILSSRNKTKGKAVVIPAEDPRNEILNMQEEESEEAVQVYAAEEEKKDMVQMPERESENAKMISEEPAYFEPSEDSFVQEEAVHIKPKTRVIESVKPVVLEEPETKQLEIRIMWILDGTYSFKTVFPAVYYLMRKIVNYYDSEKERLRLDGITFTHGLIVMKEEPLYCEFSADKYFTSDKNELLKYVRAIELCDGNSSGRENFKAAILAALETLNVGNNDNVCKGIFLFSDSLPEEDIKAADLEKALKEKGIQEQKIRFAHIYSYDAEQISLSLPKTGENGKNYHCKYTLSDFIGLNQEALSKHLKELAGDLWTDCSVILNGE